MQVCPYPAQNCPTLDAGTDDADASPSAPLNTVRASCPGPVEKARRWSVEFPPCAPEAGADVQE
jgi:hypothetical protein